MKTLQTISCCDNYIIESTGTPTSYLYINIMIRSKRIIDDASRPVTKS